MTVSLTLACGPYDRTAALWDGRVQPAGIDLTYLTVFPEEAFWRMTRHGEFDAAEMSMSSYILRRSRGDDALIALPVFTSRFFRHSYVFVRADAGIQRPEDLKGKRIGVPEYQMTAAVWQRGFLQDDYGVRPSDVHWYQGGLEQPGRVEKLAIQVPGVEITPIGPGQTLSRMLAEGELDAVIGARAPSSFDGKRVARLFPDFRRVEADYFRRTRLFPIMHTVVVRRDVLERNPWVARNLYDAFCEAKRLTIEHYGSSVALHVMLPWLVDEFEQTRALMGDDYWAYGVEENRRDLEALARYSHEQGLAARLVQPEELFAPTTLDEYRI